MINNIMTYIHYIHLTYLLPSPSEKYMFNLFVTVTFRKKYIVVLSGFITNLFILKYTCIHIT